MKIDADKCLAWFKDEKNLSIVGAVLVVLLILGGAYYYFYGEGTRGNTLLDTETLSFSCYGASSWSEAEIADFDATIQQVLAQDQIKARELVRLLPDGCLAEVIDPDQEIMPVPGECLVLDEDSCGTHDLTVFEGQVVYGFYLPPNTPIFSPYDGAFFYEELENKGYSKISLGIPNTPTFVEIVGDIQPRWNSGDSISKGDWIGSIGAGDIVLEEETGSNVVIYATEDYDIVGLLE